MHDLLSELLHLFLCHCNIAVMLLKQEIITFHFLFECSLHIGLLRLISVLTNEFNWIVFFAVNSMFLFCLMFVVQQTLVMMLLYGRPYCISCRFGLFSFIWYHLHNLLKFLQNPQRFLGSD